MHDGGVWFVAGGPAGSLAQAARIFLSAALRCAGVTLSTIHALTGFERLS